MTTPAQLRAEAAALIAKAEALEADTRVEELAVVLFESRHDQGLTWENVYGSIRGELRRDAIAALAWFDAQQSNVINVEIVTEVWPGPEALESVAGEVDWHNTRHAWDVAWDTGHGQSGASRAFVDEFLRQAQGKPVTNLSEIPTPSREPRVWEMPEAPDCRIYDRDGTIWRKRADGTWISQDGFTRFWQGVFIQHGPLTEVIEGDNND